MKQEDWKKLCKHIHEKNCILVIGSEFPIELSTENKSTTFAELLSGKIKRELRNIPRLPEPVLNQIDRKDLWQLTVDYLNYKGVDKRISREDLECVITDYFTEINPDTESKYFEKLLFLPFTLVANTNYTKLFQKRLDKPDKCPNGGHFNFRNKSAEILQTGTADCPGTVLNPFVYNLFGSIDNSGSLVISDTDLIEFALNVISKRPGLPENIQREFTNPQKIFLFLGLNFLQKNWYMRILLQALESNNKDKMSYAIESTTNTILSDDQAAALFKDELKVSIHHFNQEDFINRLLEQYHFYYGSLNYKTTPGDAPKVFISYKSEDYVTVNEICHRLKQQGINTWIDKERLHGKWESTIAREIAKSDAFILMHSHHLVSNPVNYVNVEIKEALDRSRYYGCISDFIFPAFINSNLAISSAHDALTSLHFYDLTTGDKIDQLARDIKRSYDCNRRRPAA